jgi:hypothetical protein
LPDANLFSCGTTEPYRDYSEKYYPHDWDQLVSVFPELAGYKPSPNGANFELGALIQLSQHLRVDKGESKKYLVMANEVLKLDTPSSPQPAWFSEHLPSLVDVLNCIRLVKRDKHPGFPGILLGMTKGQLIDHRLPDLVSAVYVRLLSLLHVMPHIDNFPDAYRNFCCDFSCVGIKPEAVKVSSKGRVLILNSLVTEVVEKLLYSEFNTSFKRGCYEFYSAIGVGFSVKDTQCLRARLGVGDMFFSDVPKFDSTKSLFEALLNVELVDASYLGVPPPIKTMMTSLERCFMDKVFVLGDGGLYGQSLPGWGPTGRDDTANFNTTDRSRRSVAVTLCVNLSRISNVHANAVCISAGDDCCEDPHYLRETTYGELGFPLRDASISDVMSFCSHEWPIEGRPVGMRIYKMLATLCFNEVIDFEQFLGVYTEFNNHPHFPAIVDKLSEHRPEMKYIMQKMRCVSRIRNKELDDILSVVPPSYDPHRKKKKKKAVTVTTLVTRSTAPAPVVVRSARQKKKKGKKRGVSGAFMRRICSLIDPFCIEANGAKFPDNSSLRTFPYRVRGTLAYVTNGSGNGLAVYKLILFTQYLVRLCQAQPGLTIPVLRPHPRKVF